MAPYAEPGSTFKRTLSADDIEGLCAIYPLAEDPDECAEPLCGLDLTGESTACLAVVQDDGDADCGCRTVGGSGVGSPLTFWRLLSALLLQK